MTVRPSSRSDRIRVLIVDDHSAIREALTEILTDAMDMASVGSVSTSKDAVDVCQQQAVDIVVTDLSLPGKDGLDLLANLNHLSSEIRILVYSMHEEKIYAERVLETGGRGYLMKTAPVEEVLHAIRTIHQGRIYLSETMRTRLLRHLAEDNEGGLSIRTLTSRERAVFEGLGRGASIEAVAEQLDITRKTAEHHRRQIKNKLGLESTGQVLQYAIAWVESKPEEDGQS